MATRRSIPPFSPDPATAQAQGEVEIGQQAGFEIGAFTPPAWGAPLAFSVGAGTIILAPLVLPDRPFKCRRLVSVLQHDGLATTLQVRASIFRLDTQTAPLAPQAWTARNTTSALATILSAGVEEVEWNLPFEVEFDRRTAFWFVGLQAAEAARTFSPKAGWSLRGSLTGTGVGTTTPALVRRGTGPGTTLTVVDVSFMVGAFSREGRRLLCST